MPRPWAGEVTRVGADRHSGEQCRYHADGLLLRMKEEDWNLVLQVNLNVGPFICTKTCPSNDEAAIWRIVNIARLWGRWEMSVRLITPASKGSGDVGLPKPWRASMRAVR